MKLNQDCLRAVMLYIENSLGLNSEGLSSISAIMSVP